MNQEQNNNFNLQNNSQNIPNNNLNELNPVKKNSKKSLFIIISIICIVAIVITIIIINKNNQDKTNNTDNLQDKNSTNTTEKSSYSESLYNIDALLETNLIEKVNTNSSKTIKVPDGKVLVVYNDEIIDTKYPGTYDIDSDNKYYFVNKLKQFVNADSFIMIDNIKYTYELTIVYDISNINNFFESYYNKNTSSKQIFENELKEFLEQNLNDSLMTWLNLKPESKQAILDAIDNNDIDLLEAYLEEMVDDVTFDILNTDFDADSGLSITDIKISNFQKSTN